MKNENNLLLSYFIIVVLLACTVYFLNENNLLRMQLADRESEVAAVNAEMGAKEIFVIDAKQELMDFRRNITQVEEKVDDSRKWFMGNSHMPDSLGNFTSQVRTRCIENGTLRLPCIEDRMATDLDYKFKGEWTDRLYPIDEMIERTGGDCDDYSLFAMALLNTMKEDGVAAELGAVEEANPRISFFGRGEDESEDSSDGSMSIGSLQSVYPVEICYTISSSGDAISGHCIVALSPVPIESADDLQKLNGSATFDPQNGEFGGTIGDEYGVCKDGDEGCELRSGNMNIVVTEDDIYEFKDGEWKYFGKYEKQIDTILGTMDATLTSTESWD